jgi:hypothetical protein
MNELSSDEDDARGASNDCRTRRPNDTFDDKFHSDIRSSFHNDETTARSPSSTDADRLAAETRAQARMLMECGVRLALKGQLKGAEKLLQDAAQLDPAAPATHINLANVLADLHQAAPYHPPHGGASPN